VLKPVVVVLEGAAGVVGRIDEDAFHPAGELGFERLQREQVVAEDEPVVEDVVFGDSLRRVIGERSVLEQDARLELRSPVLAHPGEFELLLLHSGPDVVAMAWPAARAAAGAPSIADSPAGMSRGSAFGDQPEPIWP
jgi:hypothetical protein